MKNWARSNKGFLAFLLLFGIFRTAIADWNPIPSGSMRPNLLEGDVVFVNRLAFDLKLPLTDVILAHMGEPQRGDVVTFYSPLDRTHLIKRLIAVPGDVVEMRNERLIINGKQASYDVLGEAPEPMPDGRTTVATHLKETVAGKERQVQFLPRVVAMRDF